MSAFDDAAKQALSDAGAQCGDCGDQPGDRICPACERCYGWYVAALRKAGWAPRTETLNEAADALEARVADVDVPDTSVTWAGMDAAYLRHLAATPATAPVPVKTAEDETEAAVEYGIATDNEYGQRVLDPSTDRAESLARLARCQNMWPNSRLVQRTVRYGTWTEVTS